MIFDCGGREWSKTVPHIFQKEDPCGRDGCRAGADPGAGTPHIFLLFQESPLKDGFLRIKVFQEAAEGCFFGYGRQEGIGIPAGERAFRRFFI